MLSKSPPSCSLPFELCPPPSINPSSFHRNTLQNSLQNPQLSRDSSCLLFCCFSYILNFLRTAELTLPCDFKEAKLLRKEADFYQIEPLIQCLGDPKPLLPYPTDSYEEVVELSSTRKLSKYSNPVAVIITQLTITTKVCVNM